MTASNAAAPGPVTGPPGAVERFAFWAAGKLLVAGGRRAAARRDWHEADHALAALKYGNGAHRRVPCALQTQDRRFGPDATEEGMAANVAAASHRRRRTR